MRVLLFNPETEYALATGASFYTPPATVEALRKEKQLLPELWANDGDAILIDNDASLSSSFRLVKWMELAGLFRSHSGIVVEPWGWNHALRRKLVDNGVPESSLPSLRYLDLIRKLAHRRTTIQLTSEWNLLTGLEVDLPAQLFCEEECMKFLSRNPGCWMKAPWSSSGRGVINTSADMSDDLVGQWCRGIIRRQGSVMAETGADKIADFATEWKLLDGKAEFLRLSSFSTSNRGKYIANDRSSQSQLMENFDRISNIPIQKVIQFQKKIIRDGLQGYNGLLGVDMIVERDGSLRPFVEVNLRRTMGMI